MLARVWAVAVAVVVVGGVGGVVVMDDAHTHAYSRAPQSDVTWAGEDEMLIGDHVQVSN